jgi:hypothetical protein
MILVAGYCATTPWADDWIFIGRSETLTDAISSIFQRLITWSLKARLGANHLWFFNVGYRPPFAFADSDWSQAFAIRDDSAMLDQVCGRVAHFGQ